MSDHDHDVMTLERFKRDYPDAPDYRPKMKPEMAEKVEEVDEPKHEKKAPVAFKPNKKQLGVAKVRIREALACRGYSVPIERKRYARGDAVAFCMKHVSNNRGQLGSRETGDFRLVIEMALDQLLKEKVVEIEEELGTFKLIQKPRRRKHHRFSRVQPARRSAA